MQPFTPDQIAMVRLIVDAAVRAALATAETATRRPTVIAGVISDISGGTAYVQPDDNPSALVAATRTSSAQVAGERVLIFHVPPSGVFLLGPVP